MEQHPPLATAGTNSLHLSSHVLAGERERGRGRRRGREGERGRGRETKRKEREGEKEGEGDREGDGEREREMERETDRQRERERDRGREKKRELLVTCKSQQHFNTFACSFHEKSGLSQGTSMKAQPPCVMD